MELLQLRYFLTVAELQHITKAAEALYITQPALSRSISRLESSVGVPLFNRVGMRIELNKSGQIFYDYAKRAIDLLDHGMYLATDAYNQMGNQISIGASVPGILPMFIDDFISQIHDSGGKGPRFRASILAPQNLARQVLDGAIAFGICMFRSDNAKLDWIPLFDEELFVVIGSKNERIYRPVEPLSSFSEESFVCNIDWENRRIINEACMEAGFVPRIAVETNEILTYDVVQHIEYGIAVAPAHMCEEMLIFKKRTPEKICRVSQPRLHRQLGIIRRADRSLEGDERMFYDSVLAHSRKLSLDVAASAVHIAEIIGASEPSDNGKLTEKKVGTGSE